MHSVVLSPEQCILANVNEDKDSGKSLSDIVWIVPIATDGCHVVYIVAIVFLVDKLSC